MDPEQRRELRRASRELHGNPDRVAADVLAEAAAWCRDRDVGFDNYGTGEVLEELETRVAALLGFEAARFMPSGTMAQQIALRIWSERAGTRHVGMHPTSHVELHEERGYAHLHGMVATLVGPADRPLLAEHLAAEPERLAALLVELPIREAGGQLPTWDELAALKAVAAARRVPLHLDGARLWECGPAYGRRYAEITAGFGSCYVSFYKGIGALSGSMLLGSTDFIEEAKVWQRRHGGNLFTLLPNAVTATMNLDARLAKMPLWLAHAHALTAALRDVPGVHLLPDPPHVNMVHLFLDMSPDQAEDARDRVALATGLWLFGRPRRADRPGTSRCEVYFGDNALGIEPDELAEAFGQLSA